MNPAFFDKMEQGLSTERLGAYAVSQGGVAPDPCATLARYLLNMALCESLYSPLQLCEIALRNAIHRHASALMGRVDWYDDPRFLLTPWAADEVAKAKSKITKTGKPITAGRVVAELQFGFWCSLFEAHYEQRTPFLPGAFKAVFPHLPKSLHKRKDRKRDLDKIRQLRNRVFHHERIVHWKDLDAQHQLVLDIISWVSPEVRQMADALDRFSSIRQRGLSPWIAKLKHHWPHATPPAPQASTAIETVDKPINVTNGAETPFGHRYGGDVFTLDAGHLAALMDGKILMLDVQSEYIAYLQLAESAKLETAIKSNMRGLGDGS